MKFIPTKLEGVILIEHDIWSDNRGYFFESYQERKWLDSGISFQPKQENFSLTKQVGTIRGLHFQRAPWAQAKAVRVITGTIFDVAVDIRPNSPTYRDWIGVVLSESNNFTFYLPKGFAHGFCTLTPDVRLAYLVDEVYHPESEQGILWNDPTLNIIWPLSNPVLSERDQQHPCLQTSKLGSLL